VFYTYDELYYEDFTSATREFCYPYWTFTVKLYNNNNGFFEFSSKFRNNSYRILIVAKRFGIGLIVFAA